jgi:hypothetical protein
MPTPLNITYVDPDGGSWDLSDLSFSKGYVCAGIAGIEGFPVAMQTVPMLDGTAIPSFYIPQPGTIALAVLVGSPEGNPDPDDSYYSLLDRFVRAFYNRRNEAPRAGYIQVQRPNGSVRQIQVYTTAGLDSPEVGLNNLSVYSVTLQTPDPYWSDLQDQSLLYSLGVAPGILPLMPVRLGAGTVLGTTVITNNGGAQSWPTWTITGPGTPTIKNLTSGRQWSLNTSIPAGNVVQITTKPGTQYAVNLTTAANIWDQLVLGGSISNLWALMTGDNSVSIAMAGATSATSVQANWTNRWNRA